MAHQHAREPVAHLGRRRTDRNRPRQSCRRDTGGRNRAGRGCPVRGASGLRHRPVVHDRAVRVGAGDRRKAQIAEMLALAAQCFEPGTGGDLGEPGFRRLMRQPREKPRRLACVRQHLGSGRSGYLPRIKSRISRSGSLPAFSASRLSSATTKLRSDCKAARHLSVASFRFPEDHSTTPRLNNASA
jgi:hypothetical protein